MLVKFECPACHAESTISLVESIYRGPFRCWKCHTLFTIELKDNKLTSWESLSEDDFQKQQEMKTIQDKLKRQFPGREGND